MCIRYGICCSWIGRNPLVGTSRAFHQIPIVTEQRVKEAVVPFGRGRCPCTFQATADRVTSLSTTKTALPTKALLFNTGSLRFSSNMCCITSTMSLPETMSPGDERYSLFIIHSHTCKGFTNISTCSNRTWFTIRPFRVYIDQTHLHSGQRILKFTITRVAFIIKPLTLSSPVGILFWFPDVFTPATKTKCLESHRLQCTVTCKNH